MNKIDREKYREWVRYIDGNTLKPSDPFYSCVTEEEFFDENKILKRAISARFIVGSYLADIYGDLYIIAEIRDFKIKLDEPPTFSFLEGKPFPITKEQLNMLKNIRGYSNKILIGIISAYLNKNTVDFGIEQIKLLEDKNESD